MHHCQAKCNNTQGFALALFLGHQIFTTYVVGGIYSLHKRGRRYLGGYISVCLSSLGEGDAGVAQISMSSTNEDAAAAVRLSQRLDLVRALENHQEGKHFDLARPGSELDLDDEIMAPYQTSHLVGHCLSVSLDALRTTRWVLQDPDNPTRLRLPMIGAYSTIRTAVESAALAVWLLQSPSRETRLVRSLQARWDDIIHDDQLVQAMTESLENETKAAVSEKQRARRANSKQVREGKRIYRDIARGQNISENDFNRGLPGFGPIIGDAAADIKIPRNFARGSWHLISGLTHPSASRTMTASRVSYSENDGDILQAEFTANTAMVNQSLESAILFRIAALRLVGARGMNPDVPFKQVGQMPLGEARETPGDSS